jgi:endonuclease-3 related protein
MADGRTAFFTEYSKVCGEVQYGWSRLELLFSGALGLGYVEAKSVNLVEDGIALFPGLPTTRGIRHLLELGDAVAEGHRAAACFVIQRNDAYAAGSYRDQPWSICMTRSPAKTRLLMDVYDRLFAAYGPQGWWPSNDPFETIMGAILTQNTAWVNVEKAFVNLRAAELMTPRAIRSTPNEELAEVIRPSGYFNTKARKLKAIAEHLALYDDDTGRWRSRDAKELRAELLGVYGIGPETADDIVLYVAKLPSFVMDTYTMRMVDRIGVAPRRKRYQDYQALFEDNLPNNAPLFNEYHALLDEHSKAICRKRNPACGDCVLLEICRDGKRGLA